MLTDSSRIYTLKPLHTLVWTLRNILLKQQFSDFSTEIYPWRSSDLSMIQSTVFVVCWCGTSLLFFCLRRKNCLNVTRTLFKKTLFSFWKYHQQSPFLASGAHWCLFVNVVLASFHLFISSCLILYRDRRRCGTVVRPNIWHQRLPWTSWFFGCHLLPLFSHFQPFPHFIDRMLPKLRHLWGTWVTLLIVAHRLAINAEIWFVFLSTHTSLLCHFNFSIICFFSLISVCRQISHFFFYCLIFVSTFPSTRRNLCDRKLTTTCLIRVKLNWSVGLNCC